MAENQAGKAALEQEVSERKERLEKVGKEIYKDGRTILAAAGLGYLSSKGITGLDHSSAPDALRIAAEVPLYTAAVGASMTKVLAGLREIGHLIEGAAGSVSFLSAKHRLSSLDEAAGQRLRNSGLSGTPALSAVESEPKDPLDRWILVRQQAAERGASPDEAVREANLAVYGDARGPKPQRQQPDMSLS